VEIDRALEEDHARNTAEYLAQFRSDLEGYVSIEVVEGCVGGHREILPVAGNTYRAFVDPAGGSGEDSFTAAVGHKSLPDDRIVVDAVREFRPRFSPAAVIDELAPWLAGYRITRVTGDHFAGEFPRELFRKHGIHYEVCKQPKSDLYRDLLPLLNSGRIVLPRNDRLVAQIVGLERRVTRVGKDDISHPPNQHDDLSNSAAGLASCIRVHASFLERWGAALADEPPARSQPQESELQRRDSDRVTAYFKALENESWQRYHRAQRGER
jgi:hypothetical protein